MTAKRLLVNIQIFLALLFATRAKSVPVNETWKDGSNDNIYSQLQDLLTLWENSTSPPPATNHVKDILMEKMLKVLLSSMDEQAETNSGDISKKNSDADFIARWRQQKMRIKLNHYKSKLSQRLFDEIARI